MVDNVTPTLKERKAKLKALRAETEDETAAEREFIRWRALNDLYWFGAVFLGYGDTGAEESGVPRFDPDFHGWLCEELSKPGSCAILIPRDHLKSTWVTIYLAQQVLRAPESMRAVVLSSSRNVAQRSISMVVDCLTHPKVLEYFGDVIPHPGEPMTFKSWETKNRHAFTANRFPQGRAETEYKAGEEQVQAWGMGTRFTGTHFKLMVFDDIVDPDNVNTPELIQKVKEWVSYCLDILDPHGKLIVIGTRYHFHDVYQTVLDSAKEASDEEPIVQRVVMRSCVEHPDHPGEIVNPDLLDDPQTTPIYRFYTKEMLRKKKINKWRLTGSNYQFNCQYFLSPLADSEKIFPRPFPEFTELPGDPVEDFAYYLAVDQAIKSKAQSDPTALCIAAVQKKLHNIYILESINVRDKPEKVCQRIIALRRKYPLRAIGFEDVAWDHYHYILFSEWQKWEHRHGELLERPQIKQIHVDRGKSKVTRIDTRLGALYRSTKVALHEDLVELKDQMDAFPHGGFDDLVDAADIIIPTAPELERSHALLQDTTPRSTGMTWRQFIRQRREKRNKKGWRDQFVA